MKQHNKYHGLKDWRQYKYWRNRITALIRKSKISFQDLLTSTGITPFFGDMSNLCVDKMMMEKFPIK